MKDGLPLFPDFQNVFNSRTLSLSEIEKIAEKILSSEWIDVDEPEFLCHTANILYQFGLVKQKGRPLLVALDKLLQAEEMAPEFFDLTFEWRCLWGNVFVSLSRLIHDPSLIEKGIAQYEKASESPVSKNILYWNWAEAWILLGMHSGERSDLEKGLQTYQIALKLGCSSPFFKIDLATALIIYGVQLGEPHHLEEALSSIRVVISDTYRVGKELSIEHKRALITYAFGSKCRYHLTHLEEHLNEAETAFREAILAVPAEANLWLDWGNLYLFAGWLYQDLKLIEMGIDKLTSSKLKEADPLRVSALLGKGLVFLGLFLDDLKLLKEGHRRVFNALEISPRNPELLTAAGLAEYGFGTYFSDYKAFSRAVVYFKQGTEGDSTSAVDWHGIYQSYLNWGILQKDASLIRKSIEAITRLNQLRPHSAIHLNEWGVALLQLKQVEVDLDEQQAFVEEAILKFRQGYALMNHLSILFNLGCALDQLGDLTGDEEDYEKSIEILTNVYVVRNDVSIQYQLALVFSHLGELRGDPELLYKAVDLLKPLADSRSEDETFWGEMGYALLNLSVLVYDAMQIDKSEKLKHEAEVCLLRAIENGNASANYHLACLYSLSGLVEVSLQFLKRAQKMDALPDKEDLKHDEWLDNVRETDYFKDFLTR